MRRAAVVVVVLVVAMIAAVVAHGRGGERELGRVDPDRSVAPARIAVHGAAVSHRLISAPPLAAAAGFDSERVFGSGNDWEPAVAVDPSSSRIYQVTTRYGGTKACNQCPDPALILRSSTDGGATWGA